VTRSHEPAARGNHRATIHAALLVLALGATASARAQQGDQFDLNQFRPTVQAREGFAINTADDLGHLRFGAQAYVDYSDDPLVFEANLGTAQSETVQLVHQQLTGHLQLSLGLVDRLILYMGLPYHFIIREDRNDFASGGAGLAIPGLAAAVPHGAGLGDLWFGARGRLYGERDDVFQLAIQATLNFHTASAAVSGQNYRGGVDQSPQLGGEPELLFTFNIADVLRLSGNVGYRFRISQQLFNLRLGDELTFGLGAIIELVDEQLALIVEGYGRTGVSTKTGSSGFGDREETPFEVLLGAKYHHPKGFSAGVGAGFGVTRGYGAPDYRVFAMVAYTMPGKEEGPGDLDADGVMDDVDACPTEPEDFDGYQDADGCPDPDNDADGVLDINDGAPMDPEDLDGFEDEDGVPDPDNDGDGVLDVDDQCPNEAGPVENNGCPIPDRDGDGVPDDVDNCPDEPGILENKGCQQTQLVEIQEGRLEILEKVYFKTDSSAIRPRSFPLLDNVAAVLSAHPEITLVRVEGHTDERGSAKYNRRLSQKRAESVARFLVRRGIDANRLEARGFGEERPIVQNAKTKEEHARNRRVEFHLGDTEIQQRESGPTSDTIDR